MAAFLLWFVWLACTGYGAVAALEACSSNSNHCSGTDVNAMLQTKPTLEIIQGDGTSTEQRQSGNSFDPPIAILVDDGNDWKHPKISSERSVPVVQEVEAVVDGDHVSISFSHGGSQHQYGLVRQSIYSPDAQILKGDSLIELQRSSTFRIHTLGRRASATLHGDGLISGLFEHEGSVMEVQPVVHQAPELAAALLEKHGNTKPAHVIRWVPPLHESTTLDRSTKLSEVWSIPTANDPPGAVPSNSGPAPIEDELPKMAGMKSWGGDKWFPGCYKNDDRMHEMIVGIVTDVEAMEKYDCDRKGNCKRGNYAGLQAKLESIVSEASFVYEMQLNFKLKIGYLHMATEQNNTGYGPCTSDEGSSYTLSARLSTLSQKMKKMPYMSAVHGFSGCGKTWGVVGIATCGTVCPKKGTSNRGFNKIHTRSPWLTFAHELGHNLNARHSFEDGRGKTGGIMDYGDGKFNGHYQFNSKHRRKKEMCGKLDSVVNKCSGKFQQCAKPGCGSGPIPTKAPTPATQPPKPTPAQTVAPTTTTTVSTSGHIPTKAPTPATQPPKSTPAPTVAPTTTTTVSTTTTARGKSGKCNEAQWPDKDHGLVCGDCKVLVNKFNSKYKTCNGYCAFIDMDCAGAWEERGDSCNVQYDMKCSTALSSSDAICECKEKATTTTQATSTTAEASTTQKATTTTQATSTTAEASTTQGTTTITTKVQFKVHMSVKTAKNADSSSIHTLSFLVDGSWTPEKVFATRFPLGQNVVSKQVALSAWPVSMRLRNWGPNALGFNKIWLTRADNSHCTVTEDPNGNNRDYDGKNDPGGWWVDGNQAAPATLEYSVTGCLTSTTTMATTTPATTTTTATTPTTPPSSTWPSGNLVGYEGPVTGYCKGLISGIGNSDVKEPVVTKCADKCNAQPGVCLGFSVAPGVHKRCHLFGQQPPDDGDGQWGWQCFRKI